MPMHRIKTVNCLGQTMLCDWCVTVQDAAILCYHSAHFFRANATVTEWNVCSSVSCSFFGWTPDSPKHVNGGTSICLPTLLQQWQQVLERDKQYGAVLTAAVLPLNWNSCEHKWRLYISKGKYWKMFEVTTFAFSTYKTGTKFHLLH